MGSLGSCSGSTERRWLHFWPSCTRLLGVTGACPADFLHGVVVPVLKPGGIATDVDSYRPLQLLDYDYRLLAKVLANQLLQVAGDIIDPAQCPFFSSARLGTV
jgi:hypothetical protein